MTKQISAFLLLVSALASGWIYWNNETKLDNILMSREWQSKMVTLIETTMANDSVGPLHKVNVSSNVKYLPNGTYLRVSRVELYANDTSSLNRPDNVINISESGEWSISGNYLLIVPKEFKDISSSYSKDFNAKQLQLITQLFKLDARKSRRIDVINNQTLLLTSLNHGSSVLFGER